MKPNDFIEFSALMQDCCEYYGKSQMSDRQVELYFRLLEALTIDEVRAGLSTHMLNPDNGQFFPKAADITRAAIGDSVAMADQAWAKVMAAIGPAAPPRLRYRASWRLESCRSGTF